MKTTVTAPRQTASISTGQFEWARAFRTAKLPGTPAYSRQLRVVGLAIMTYTDQHGFVGPEHAPSTFSLALALGLTAGDRGPGIQAAKHLEELGWLAITSGGGRKVRNSYQLTVPVSEKTDCGNCGDFSGNCGDSADNCGAQDLTQPPLSNHNNPPTPAAAGARVGGNPPQKNNTNPTTGPAAAAAKTLDVALGADLPLYLNALDVLRDDLDGASVTGEGTRLTDGLQAPEFAKRFEFATMFLRLCHAGWSSEVREELTRCEVGYSSAYAGAANPAVVAWVRLKNLAAGLGTSTKGDVAPSGLPTPVASLVGRIGAGVDLGV